MIGEIKSLHPVFRSIVSQILAEMRAKGWDPVIGSGMRSKAEQAALFAQGRAALGNVNALRLRAKLPSITADDNKTIVTYARAGESNHNLLRSLLPCGPAAADVVDGYAVDIVDRRRGWNHVPSQFWNDLGDCAKKHGCRWGGDWKGKKRDRAHIEMKFIDSAPRTSFVV